MPPASGSDDGVAGPDTPFRDHAEVEAWAMMGDKQIRHLRLTKAHADAEARHSRLGHLELGLTDRVAVTDADLVVAQPADREVLPEVPRLQVVAPENAAPVVVGLGLINHHRALFAAVSPKVALAVTVDVQPCAPSPDPSTGVL